MNPTLPVRRWPALALSLAAALSLGALTLAAPADPKASIQAESLGKHVAYLASEALEGRGTATKGERLAGEYIARAFHQAGLVPAGEEGTWFQGFKVAGRTELEPGATLRLAVEAPGGAGAEQTWERRCVVGKDFAPLGFSASGRLDDAPLVFAGYGISDPERGYDDYAGLDVKGKVVLVLRYEPGELARPSRHAWFQTKAQNAQRRGARALLVVTGPAHRADDDTLLPLSGGEPAQDLVVAQVRQSLVSSLFRLLGRDLLALQKAIEAQKRPQSFALGRASLALTLKREPALARNVVGLVRGTDPKLAAEHVVVGAHYDHLGHGESGGSLSREGQGQIHNGADDNASGTAGLIELARALGQSPPRRSVLFIAFSGEELGLLGSRHFVERPTVAKESLVAMVNLDMIGRLTNDELEVGGVDTSPGFRSLVGRALGAEGLKGKLSGSGFGPSDHASFYRGGVPVLFFFTGLHADYHRPSDDAERINAEGAAKVARAAYTCARALADADARPPYVAAQRQAQWASGPRSPRLGVVPGSGEGPGVPLAQVLEGGPAAKAGLKAGDVLVRLGATELKSTLDLLRALRGLKPGGRVSAVVVRAGKRLELEVQLEAPPAPARPQAPATATERAPEKPAAPTPP